MNSKDRRLLAAAPEGRHCGTEPRGPSSFLLSASPLNRAASQLQALFNLSRRRTVGPARFAIGR